MSTLTQEKKKCSFRKIRLEVNHHALAHSLLADHSNICGSKLCNKIVLATRCTTCRAPFCFGCVRGGVELNDDKFVCGYCVSKFNDRGINDDEFVKIVAYVKRSLVQAQINLRGQSAKVKKLICDDSPYARFVFDADEIEDNGELFDDSESEDDGDYAPPDADSEDDSNDDYEEINVDASTSHLTTAATTLINNPAAANSSFVDPR